jgi:predicted Zn-dependent peptidase
MKNEDILSLGLAPLDLPGEAYALCAVYKKNKINKIKRKKKKKFYNKYYI